jgi:hypothetical protein
LISENKIAIDKRNKKVYDYRNPSENNKIGFTTHCFIKDKENRRFGIVKDYKDICESYDISENDFNLAANKFPSVRELTRKPRRTYLRTQPADADLDVNPPINTMNL